MRNLLIAAALLLAGQAHAGKYVHLGLNQVNGGVFFPIAGAESDQQAGFVVPVLEHDAADGYLLVPGISWNPLNLGYVGSVEADIHKFLAGKVAFGPSLQWGEFAKSGLRFACHALPYWDSAEHYGLLKGILASGEQGMYADVGVYGAVPLNKIFPLNHAQPELLVGLTLNKRFGGAPPAVAPAP